MNAQELAEGVVLVFGLDPKSSQGARLSKLIVSAIKDAVEFGVKPDRIDELEAALTTIRDTLPLQHDAYARMVFRVAANALEPYTHG